MRKQTERLSACSKKYAVILFILVILIGLACSRVPKEVVELSYQTGQDIMAIHESYDKLIHKFYNQLREQRIDYLEDTWTPLFIEKWIDNGRLIDVAKGNVVWSEQEEEFVSPAQGKEKQQLLNTISNWAQEAIYEIDLKRDSLILPLNAEEDSLMADVNQAFIRIMWANNTITAHLNSLRKVQEVQDKALQALGIRDLRDKINNELDKASVRAAEGLEKIKKADLKVLELKEKVDSL